MVAFAVVLLEDGLVGTQLQAHVFGTGGLETDHPWLAAGVSAGFFAAACAGSLVTWRTAQAARVGRLTQEQLVAGLEHRARHDELTGLPNRTALVEAAERALADQAPVSVVLIDLDRFKEINDTLGHGAGDELLTLVGPLMRDVVGLSGLLVRLGGDEFAVLLPHHTSEQAREVALAVTEVATHTLLVGGVPVSVGASAGVATVVQGSDEREVREQAMGVLLRQADVAMYAAKGDRSGVEAYDPAKDPHSTERLSTLHDMRGALRAEDQVVLHFQPKVRLDDGRLEGVEALVRWQHPTRGLLPPGEFVALVERTDLSEAFTAQVIDLALRQIARWTREGRWIPVAVNVSPRSLLRPGFIPGLVAALDAHRVDPSLLKVEITEDALVADPHAAIDVLRQLRGMGVTTSVDDFGTGFSSLSYLRRLPLDELKIDRSFVTGLGCAGAAGADEVLVSSIIELGHRLGLHVIAEGVEHPDELAALRRLGCDAVQGYLFSRPVPAGDIPAELLRSALTGAATGRAEQATSEGVPAQHRR